MKNIKEKVMRIKVKGKYLAWALIHFSFFTSTLFQYEPEEIWMALFLILMLFFFGWRFIINMEIAFK